MSVKNKRLWYNKPAEEWVEALPIGNGRFGGMAYGGIKHERISLNEDTLWAGTPREADNFEAIQYLEQTRHLIFEGKYREAQTIIENHMLGPWSNSYQAMGNLDLEFMHGSDALGYRRELDLGEALFKTQFTRSGVRYTREAFISAVDQVMAIRLESDQQGSLDFDASLSSPLNYSSGKVSKNHIILKGQAPSVVDPMHDQTEDPVIYEEGKGMTFQIHLKALAEGGRVEVHGSRLVIRSADAVTLLISGATSFNGFNKDPFKEGKDPEKLCLDWLEKASKFTYRKLKARHIRDHQHYFNRVDFDLVVQGREELPTDERILSLREGGRDDQLAVLFFHFGRYLLICSSRPGSQPANLQGIWNNMTRPPWTCNYTANINTEMNYWPAEPCNLAEFHYPLFEMMEDLRVTGRKMAEVYYNCGGWTAHHGIDLWRTATPQGGPSKGPASWAYWPMTGPWLCQHLWEHFLYSGDKEFLRKKAYPIMKEAAKFFLDYLIEDEHGNLVTIPSTSPENTFIAPDGTHSAISMSSTMDIALIWDLFTNCMESGQILEEDEQFRKIVEKARDRLLPLQIGKHGQLQEWFQDFEEAEPGHRHTAHLYALHPSSQITPRSTPELAKAARVTLDRRRVFEGTDTIGWCFAWNVNMYARLEEPEMSYDYLVKLLRNPFPNLFNAHRHPKLKFYPLTIEANFAATAGIIEMLLQSHDGEIHLLPALPKAWDKGRISGIRARGGYEINMEWDKGTLTLVEIKSSLSRVCKIRTAKPFSVDGTDYLVNQNGTIEFKTEPNKSYILTPSVLNSTLI
ncbi:glycoside hydrolase family 95 protein [Mesobacillus foraminis]|uniref:glycoside hydrolase family 95 protein n=1 Tax=Mesobacillus foraminis TaxID=279826 RepID=UPI001BEAB2FF|nr:glycoside hydrolase family 95 protein [Mesobacillus foraminis]MBT2757807.1 glycoside hydrolase family 95 protein [Mesobacillus foraminis]